MCFILEKYLMCAPFFREKYLSCAPILPFFVWFVQWLLKLRSDRHKITLRIWNWNLLHSSRFLLRSEPSQNEWTKSNQIASQKYVALRGKMVDINRFQAIMELIHVAQRLEIFSPRGTSGNSKVNYIVGYLNVNVMLITYLNWTIYFHVLYFLP